MNRFAFVAMISIFGVVVALLLIMCLVHAPMTTSGVVTLLYSTYVIFKTEDSSVHASHDSENHFWTLFAIVLASTLFFVPDSPLAFGFWYTPAGGFVAVVLTGYLMQIFVRHLHCLSMNTPLVVVPRLSHYYASFDRDENDNNESPLCSDHGFHKSLDQHSRVNPPPLPPRNGRTVPSVTNEVTMMRSFSVPDATTRLQRISACLNNLETLLIPSVINNRFNQPHVLANEREIITIFRECDTPSELNWLISHVHLGPLMYKIKDHGGDINRTNFIQLLAVDRLPVLTVASRVILLHALQLLKLSAHPFAEELVASILCHTNAQELSELKTLTDAKGNYFCMNKLLFVDMRTESIRCRILDHFQYQARVVAQRRDKEDAAAAAEDDWKPLATMQQFRKVLSDVDDTLTCSGGNYPNGIDKRYPKKAVYPGVLAFYRELDLGTRGPTEWEEDRVGNLVFLSARPHVYKDVSERMNFAKFEKLRSRGFNERQGMHTVPSLLTGDLASGISFIVNDDFSPLALKKFDNFRNYASIYPEYRHVFVCDNGQGDVSAGELMFDAFPQEMEAVYVHVVQDVRHTYGYDPEKWREKGFAPCFFRTYPEAALHAVKRQPPLIRVEGLRRICCDAAQDFMQIKGWPANSPMKAQRRQEVNQDIYKANEYLIACGCPPVPLIPADRVWRNGEQVRTPYGIGRIRDFNASFDLYLINLDWRPRDKQGKDHISSKAANTHTTSRDTQSLSVVSETGLDDEMDVPLGEQLESNSRQLVLSTRRRALHPLDNESMARASRVPPRSSSDGASDPLIPCATSAKGELEKLDQKPALRAYCRISGKCIQKYSPPILPKVDRKSGASILSSSNKENNSHRSG